MSLPSLKTNIEHEKKLIENMAAFLGRIKVSKNKNEIKLLTHTINSMVNQLKIINNAIPGLLNNISLSKKLPSTVKTTEKKDLSSVTYTSPHDKTQKFIVLNKGDKEKFLRELSINEESIRKLKKGKKIEAIEKPPFKKRSVYTKISNKFFFNFSEKLIDKGYFSSLNLNLKKANFRTTLNSYVSIMFFSTVISFILGFFLVIFLLFVNVSIELPFFSLYKGDILIRFLKTFWVMFLIPILTFISYYFYPWTEKDSIGKKIEKELPFVTIQMSAIASAEIEPSKIFKIVALTKDYPYTSAESIKIMNQINLYGYGVINALRNVARNSPSKKFADLLEGMAATITSGGELSKFLDKISESLLLDYRLREEKYTKLTETFMDLYISIVIAAPMLLMLLIAMIKISGIGFQMSMGLLTFSIVSGVAVINIIFLAILHLNQSEL